jgi:hypothetical protein
MLGAARPLYFTVATVTNKVAVYAPAERADTVPLFHLYSYVLCVYYNSAVTHLLSISRILIF